MKRKDNVFGIRYAIIVLLVQLGALIPIVHKSGVSVKGDHQYPENGYFRIAGTNFVWMHVQDGYGIIINEFITTRSGKRINLVEVLSKYYWYIDNTSNIVKAHELDNRAVYRCIMSIILYDDIKKKMPKWIEVHHKWWKWCNTQNAITEACHSKHQYFHNYINSRKSHKRGALICSVKDLSQWRYVIFVEDAKMKNQQM